MKLNLDSGRVLPTWSEIKFYDVENKKIFLKFYFQNIFAFSFRFKIRVVFWGPSVPKQEKIHIRRAGQ